VISNPLGESPAEAPILTGDVVKMLRQMSDKKGSNRSGLLSEQFEIDITTDKDDVR
jgi:hypothetical protein